MATKKTNKQERSKKSGLRMSDDQKRKYAELFIGALDGMEACNWTKPWVSPHNGKPCNLYRKTKPYRRSNAFFLTLLCQLNGWNTPYFLTKTQLKNVEGTLKYKNLQANATMVADEDGTPKFDDKGMPVFDYEKRFPVIFWKPYHVDKDGKKLTDEEYEALSNEEQDECKTRFYQDSYLVYNIDQTNLKELYPDDYAEMMKVPEHKYKEGTRDEVLEKMIAGEWRCPILFGGHTSHYNPQEDHIRLPERSQFLGDELFYSTAIHEMAHSTSKELDRDVANVFGSEAYAMEEFVAELTAACACSMLGIGKLLDKQHLAYVDNWKQALKNDKDFIPLVIDHVQKAVNFILNKYDAVAKAMNPIALPLAA